MTYSSMISWLTILGRINPAAWDWIVPQGPVLSSAASKVGLALILKSISGQESLQKFGPRLAAAGKQLFAEGVQEFSYEDEPDICPSYPWYLLHGSHPRPNPPDPWPIIYKMNLGPVPDPWLIAGPQPEPWKRGPHPDPWQTETAELNPQPLPPHTASLLLRQIASVIKNEGISKEVSEIAAAMMR